MLQSIRDNSQGWIAKTLIGLIVVLLALTGVDAIISSTSNSQNAAEVNGEKITIAELNQAVDAQRRQFIQQLGKDFDASLLDEKLLRNAALNGLVERKLLLQGADSAHFAFSQSALDQFIRATPEFQVDGKFDPNRFDQVITRLGYSRLQFRQMFDQEMQINQLRAGLAGSAFVTDAQVDSFVQLERQPRDFATIRVRADETAVSLRNADIKAYYDDHIDQYMSLEQVVVEYIELKKDDFFDQIDVSEQDIQALYRKEIANLAEQRQAAHILIEVNDAQSDEQAKGQIEEIKKRLDQGEDFRALAKEYSQDQGSAANGGDLGYAGPGVYDPAFEQALYALSKGQVSAPVRTEFGWHLIKLLDVQEPEIPSLDSMREKLVRDLKEAKVEQRFVEATQELENSAFESADLTQPAQELGLRLRTSSPFGREGGERGITANRQVVQAAFSPAVLVDGSNSEPIELDPDTVVVLRLKEHKQSEQLPLEKVADGIRLQLKQQQAAESARQQGEKLLALLQSGQEPLGEDWQSVEASTRNQEGIDSEVIQAVFRMPKPSESGKPTFAGLTLNNGDYMLIRLTGVGESKVALTDEERNMYRRFLASRSGQEDFAAYRRLLKEKADIERF